MKRCIPVMFLVFCLMFAAACSSQDAPQEQSSTVVGEQPANNTEVPAPPTRNEPVNIVFYTTAGWTEDAFNERFGDAIRKKFPQYTIQALFSGPGTTFNEIIVSNQQVDIYWQDVNSTIPNLLEFGLAYDMSELIKKYQVPVEKLEPSSIAGIRSMSNGGLYAMPLVINTAVLYYNKDIFDKLALPYLKDNMSWDEVIELGKRAHRQEGGIDYLGIRNGMQPHGNLNPLSVPFIDPVTEKPTVLQDERWRTIFTQLIEMRKTMNNTTASFVRDPKVAMSADLANIFLNNDMTQMNWDLVTYPQYAEFPERGAQPLPTLFGITSTSKFKDEAMLVLKHLVSEEVQLGYSKRAIIPALQDDEVRRQFATEVVYKDTVYKDKNFQAIIKKPFAPIPQKTRFETIARAPYEKQLSDLVKGTVDLNTAFRMIDEELSKLIAERKGN